MAEKILNNKLVLLLLLTGAVFFFLKVITPFTAPVLLALLFVTIFGPLLQRWQQRFRLHRQVGVLILLLLAGSVLGVLVWVLFSWIVGSLPDWLNGLDALAQEMAGYVHELCRLVEQAMGIDGAYLEQLILACIQDGIDYFQLEFLPDMLSQSLEYVKLFARLGGFLITFVIAAVLLAKDYDEIMNQLLDREECHVFLEVICGIIRYIATFVKAQVIIMSVIGILSAAVLGICGIRHGVMWGLLAGILDALPFVGTGIVLMPLGIQQLFYGHYGRAAACLILYLICIFLREMLEPRLIGRRVGVPAIAILLSIYAGIRLFGIWGIIGGPLGFIMIQQSYLSLDRRKKNLTNHIS